jgi:glyoxylase-like metal-dependent hydrolase (beta-lactamase superfamily II)
MTTIAGEPTSEIVISDDRIAGYRIVSPFLQQNTYVIVDAAGASAIVIDAGVKCFKPVDLILRRLGCRLEYILLTHEHYDHIGGVNDLRERFECKVVASQSSSSRITDAKQNLSFFYNSRGYIAEPADILICESAVSIPWQLFEICVFSTPGHTTGSLCAHLSGHLFTGDTIIKDEKTVVKLPGGRGRLLSDSLDFIFATFSPETVLYPGHGKSMLLRDTQERIHYPSHRR